MEDFEMVAEEGACDYEDGRQKVAGKFVRYED
jgi:hypothetical protein